MSTFKVMHISGVRAMIVHADTAEAAAATATRRGFEVVEITESREHGELIVVAD